MRGEIVSGDRETLLFGVGTDSRTLKPGELFWALEGETYDGHDFALKALDQGAAGVLVKQDAPVVRELLRGGSGLGRRPVVAVEDTLKALGDLANWWRRERRVEVAAVTGSAGKTTTKEMAASILERSGPILKNPGNFNNLIGLPLTLLQLTLERKAILEMGMNRRGEIARLTEIADPDVGAITNVGAAHIEGLGDLRGVAAAKTELVGKMRPEAKVILNGEDPLLLETALAIRKDAITYGYGPERDVRATRIASLGPRGIAFDLEYRGESWPVRIKVPMLKNVLNALAAAAVGFCLGASPEQVVEGLEAFSGVKGRFTVSVLPGEITLIDDTYNANPSSLGAALESVRPLAGKAGRIIVGLGEMMELGSESTRAHLEAGRRAAETGVHSLVALGDHAREMAEGAVSGGMPPARAHAVSSHEEMTAKLKEELRTGDVVLLKGSRRMRLERVVEGLKGAGPEKD